MIRRGADDTLVLFCLPYAGGSAAIYRAWGERMPDWIELVPLHMPGRGIRHSMRPMHRWPALLDLLVEDVQPYLRRPFAIFGHSMGALLGFELAHTLRERHGCVPIWLGISACKAPSRRTPEMHWLDCPEAELLAEVRSLNGMPDELLDNREFMDLVLPFLRADFHLCGSYVYRRRAPLACPMRVLGGTRDDDIAQDPRNLAAWAAETRGTCERHDIEAGHFFINTHRETVIDRVVDDLAKAFRTHGQSGTALRRSYA